MSRPIKKVVSRPARSEMEAEISLKDRRGVEGQSVQLDLVGAGGRLKERAALRGGRRRTDGAEELRGGA